jgi:hypothetical protein
MLRDHEDDSNPVPPNRLREFEEEFHPTVRPFDWPWDFNETIWPCRDCAVWRAELRFEGPHDAIWVREWHAGDCAVWAEVDGLDA